MVSGLIGSSIESIITYPVVRQVFATTELLEGILKNLLKAMLYRVMKVNKTFRDNILGLVKLKRIMHLEHSTKCGFDDLIPHELRSLHNPLRNFPLRHWTYLPGDMAPTNYVLLARPGWFKFRTHFRLFCFQMVELDRIARNACVFFDLDAPITPFSEIGVVGRWEGLHLYSRSKLESWTRIKLFSMAMPVTVVVNATLAYDSPLNMPGAARMNRQRRGHRYGNGLQRISRVFQPGDATVGILFALLEEILGEVRLARRRAGQGMVLWQEVFE